MLSNVVLHTLNHVSMKAYLLMMSMMSKWTILKIVNQSILTACFFIVPQKGKQRLFTTSFVYLEKILISVLIC